jgi:hypothetical protein
MSAVGRLCGRLATYTSEQLQAGCVDSWLHQLHCIVMTSCLFCVAFHCEHSRFTAPNSRSKVFNKGHLW